MYSYNKKNTNVPNVKGSLHMHSYNKVIYTMLWEILYSQSL